jgi:nitrile hydratase beta subunit
VDGVHDMGGMHGFGAVVTPDGDAAIHEQWEARVFALHLLISQERLGAGPGGRPTREEMDPADYLAASYYERWLWSAERRLERKGTIAPGEVEATMARLAAGAPVPRSEQPERAERARERLRAVAPMARPARARFAPGDRVRVRRMHPTGHTRCPRYARGVAGVVERIQGADRLPDLAVYGRPAPVEPVYSVAFRSPDLWGPDADPPWTVRLDLWESYLEPAAPA